MNYIIIVILIILFLMIISTVYDTNLKKLEKFATEEESKFNKIIEKYPPNIEICRYLLDKLKNNKVKIVEEKNSKTSLYIAITDKIIIGDLKQSYTRIQTIAHECLHSIQDRKILLFNFIFSNMYILYFVIILVLGLFNILQNKMLFLCIMIILSYLYYFVRSYLEMDAMIKARFLAKEYLEEMNISNADEINKIIESYDKLNNSGIKMTNFSLISNTFIKVAILAIIFFI